MTSMVRAKKFAQKRQSCWMVAHVKAKASPNADAGEFDGSVDGQYHIGNLPPNCLVNFAGVYTAEGSDAATSAAGKIGTASGGSQIATGIDLTTEGWDGTYARILTGSGVEVWFDYNITGTASAGVGEYYVMIEYIELDKTTGGYTPMNEAA